MSLPKWFANEKTQRQKQNDRSRKLEQKHARSVGGRPQAGSGSSWRAEGDVRSPGYLDEHKFTTKRSYTLKLDDWLQIRDQALRDGREPRFVIEFPDVDVKLYLTEAGN